MSRGTNAILYDLLQIGDKALAEGRRDFAAYQYQKALTLAELGASVADTPFAREYVIRIQLKLGQAREDVSVCEAALALAESAAEAYDREPPDPTDFSHPSPTKPPRATVALCHRELGFLAQKAGDIAAAEQHLQIALATLQSLAGTLDDKFDDESNRCDMAQIQADWAALLYQTGHVSEAEAHMLLAVELMEALAAETGYWEYQQPLVLFLERLAEWVPERAAERYDRALHRAVTASIYHGSTEANDFLAQVLLARGERDADALCLLEAQAIWAELAREYPKRETYAAMAARAAEGLKKRRP